MQKLYAQLNVKVAPELIERIEAAATRLHESKTGYVVKAVEARLDRDESKPDNRRTHDA